MKGNEDRGLKEINAAIRKIQQEVKGLSERLDAVERRISGKPLIQKAFSEEKNRDTELIARIEEIEEKLYELKNQQPVISLIKKEKNNFYYMELTGIFMGLFFIVFGWAYSPPRERIIWLSAGILLLLLNVSKIYFLEKHEGKKRSN